MSGLRQFDDLEIPAFLDRRSAEARSRAELHRQIAETKPAGMPAASAAATAPDPEPVTDLAAKAAETGKRDAAPPDAFHPAAGIFPMMGEGELAELAADIAAHGLREAIWRHRDGRILDGRNRLLACRMAKMPPAYRTYQGTEAGVVGFVVSLNLRRRHLSESQRAMVAARIAGMSQGARTDIVPTGTKSLADAGDMMAVGRRSVARAKAVQKTGAPALAAAVEAGEVSVAAAAKVARLPAAEQERLMAAGPAAVRRAAKPGSQEKSPAPVPFTGTPGAAPAPIGEVFLGETPITDLAEPDADELLARFDAYPWENSPVSILAKFMGHATAVARANLAVAAASDVDDEVQDIDAACDAFDAAVAALTDEAIGLLTGQPVAAPRIPLRRKGGSGA